jgi:HSP20 family molecular chaperone IbpA
MTTTPVLEQLTDAIFNSLKRRPLPAPTVYEQGECVIVELPAPRVAAPELDIRLEGERTLVIGCDQDPWFHARVALPARISPADCVAMFFGDVLSLTFLKAEAVDDLDVIDEPAVALAMAAC